MQTGSEASVDEREGKPAVRKGARGPSLLLMFFSLAVISLFVNLQINQVTLQLRVSLFALAVGPEKTFFFRRGPKPLSAALSEAISQIFPKICLKIYFNKDISKITQGKISPALVRNNQFLRAI